MMVIWNIVSSKKNIARHMFFFPFLRYAIPGLDVGMLKMLIHVCFRDGLQPAVY